MAWKRTKPEHILFRELDDEEEQKFRAYARVNLPPPHTPTSIMHPVCVEEWVKQRVLFEESQKG